MEMKFHKKQHDLLYRYFQKDGDIYTPYAKDYNPEKIHLDV